MLSILTRMGWQESHTWPPSLAGPMSIRSLPCPVGTAGPLDLDTSFHQVPLVPWGDTLSHICFAMRILTLE